MRMMRNLVVPALLATLATLATSGCDGSPTGDSGGRLTIQLTDAPGDLQDAFVRIDRVVLMGPSGRLEIVPDYDDWIDLLSLSGGRVLNLVDEMTVPEGSYSELRFVLGDAYVRLNDGRVFATQGAALPVGVNADGSLRCPSCGQSGFKVKLAGAGMTVARNTTVLVDFDVAQSFGHEAGRSGQWVMHPVLRATTRSVTLAGVSGTVTLAQGVSLPPSCGGNATSITLFTPLAKLGGESVSGTVQPDGEFAIMYLFPGTHSLDYAPEITFTNGDVLAFTATVTPTTVELGEGAEGNADYEITTAVCTPAP
jgi:hypothetical protein